MPSEGHVFYITNHWIDNYDKNKGDDEKKVDDKNFDDDGGGGSGDGDGLGNYFDFNIDRENDDFDGNDDLGLRIGNQVLFLFSFFSSFFFFLFISWNNFHFVENFCSLYFTHFLLNCCLVLLSEIKSYVWFNLTIQFLEKISYALMK